MPLWYSGDTQMWASMLAMRPCHATTSGASQATLPSLTGNPADAGCTKSTSTPPCSSHMATISLAMMNVVELSRLIADTTINRIACPLSVRTASMVATGRGATDQSRRNALEPVQLAGQWARRDDGTELVGRGRLHRSQGRRHLDPAPFRVLRDGPRHRQVDLGPQIGRAELLGFLPRSSQQFASGGVAIPQSRLALDPVGPQQILT